MSSPVRDSSLRLAGVREAPCCSVIPGDLSWAMGSLLGELTSQSGLLG